MFSTLLYFLPFCPYPYRGEQVECDLCGETDYELICENDRRFKRLLTVACTGCGLMRTNPMPTPDEVSRYYKEIYRWDYQFVTKTPSRRHLSRSQREAASRLARLSPALKSGSRILDFGCGAGVFLGMAQKAGYSVRGIEPGRDYADYAVKTHGIDVICDVWENVSLPESSFDVITAVEVLEHLRQPITALKWLSSLLAPDGVIYITVPNTAPSTRETFRYFHFAHIHNFTATTLLWAGAVCGLEPDPRIPLGGTQIAFRKSASAIPRSVFRAKHGVGLSSQYPTTPIITYILSGKWMFSRFKQLQKTLRDTLNFGR